MAESGEDKSASAPAEIPAFPAFPTSFASAIGEGAPATASAPGDGLFAAPAEPAAEALLEEVETPTGEEDEEPVYEW